VRLLITFEGHVSRGSTGEIYADGPARYASWSNYLEVFDEVLILARAGTNQITSGEAARADGPSVSFCALPDYHGPWEYLQNLPELRRRVREAVARCDAFILRVPGLVGRLAWQELRRLGKAYALEVVGDPWDALGSGTWPNIFRPMFRRVAARNLKEICAGAMAVHYVTHDVLQRRYPPAKDAYAVGFSDALMDFAFVTPEIIEKRYCRIEELAGTGGDSRGAIRIGFIGSLARMYKGPDVLLRAAALCRSRGLNFEVTMVGAGRHTPEVQALARRLGMEGQTRLAGQLPSGQPIFDFLDSVDLFVMPSRAEGLPRALLEAMARGCPCIGSNVGGIPELLAEADLVPPNDPAVLAEKILEVAGDPERLKSMAQRNLEKARQFSPELLKEVRRDFFRYVRLHSGAGEKLARAAT
jgi:glycosyltransferase involved in cell wall biosynthesis